MLAPAMLNFHDHELGNLGKAAVVHFRKVHDYTFACRWSLTDGFGALWREGI